MLRAALTSLVCLSALQAILGFLAVRWFAARPSVMPRAMPPVTILKPVCGDEVLLEEAITSFCTQDYHHYQLIIGAQDPNDPALAVARRVQTRFPDRDISIVVDAASHGCNRKIANLINMMPLAKHDVLVIADSDLHVAPDYLTCVVATLERPGCGLVTTAAAAEGASREAVPQVGAAHLTHHFLPSVLLAAAMGRQDCLGGTMALRRSTLAAVGGLSALVNHLADDNVLGSLVQTLKLEVHIAPTVPVVVVQERDARSLWLHELRWARTIGGVAPFALAGTVVQFPLFWALLAVVVSGAAPWALMCFAGAWTVRAAVVAGIDRCLRARRARPAPGGGLWLLPVRDVMSVAVVVASFFGDTVVWRGHEMRVNRKTAA